MATGGKPICEWMQVIGVAALAFSSAALGQPDAGQLLQEIERERSIQLPKQIAPEIAPAPPPMKSSDTVSITVAAFQFAGNSLINSDELASVVATYLNRPLDFSDLQKTATAIADHYRKAGWVVQAYLPKQDITNGTVTIQIIEAVFGGTQFEGELPQRVKTSLLSDMAERSHTKGAPLNSRQLDRMLLLMDDLPGVTVAGSLRKGQQENHTEMVLMAADEPLVRGEVSVDNTGSRSTGSERVSANISLNSPLRIGDQLVVNLIHQRGNDFGRLAYSIPLGDDGWRAGISGSMLSYDLVASELKPLDAYGTSSTFGLDASYPIVRSRLANLYLGLNADQKHFDNHANHVTTTNYDIQNFAISLYGNLFDKLGGGGANSASLIISSVELDLDGSPNKAADKLTTQANGHFSKIQYNLSRQQILTDRLSFYAALSGQAASKNLDSAEKFYLGGAYGVRAYPSNEGGGDDGQLVNLELRARLPKNFNLTGFYNLGHVRVNHDNENVGTDPNSYTLKGYGLALAWESTSGLDLRLTWSHRIGENPSPAANGDDQDGSLLKNRWWASASLPF